MRDFIDQARDFAAQAHRKQQRKYSLLPYVTHTTEVALMVRRNGGDPAMIAAAHLHDTVEDTAVTIEQIGEVFGPDIQQLVAELTDQFDKAHHPKLNRKARKRLEAERLGKISARGQSIKFADFLSNGKDLAKQDPAFAKVYFAEVAQAILQMKDGDRTLRNAVLQMLLDNAER